MWATDSLLEAACARFDLTSLHFELVSGGVAVGPEALWHECRLDVAGRWGRPSIAGNKQVAFCDVCQRK